jgi:hypothetical protein
MRRMLAGTLILGAILTPLLGGAPAWASSPSVQHLPHGEIRWGEAVRVSAIGLPPFGASGTLNAREVARQNAMGLAQKRLLAAILGVPVGKSTVQERTAARPEVRDRLRSLILGAKVSGKELADGSVEVILEVPFTGTNGLQALLNALGN